MLVSISIFLNIMSLVSNFGVYVPIGVDLGGSRGTRPPIIELVGQRYFLPPPNNPGETF